MGLALLAFTAGAATELPPMDCVIEPNEVVDLSSAVDGVVQEMLVDRGDLVEAGQIVARLDSGVEDAALAYARARAAADAQLQAEQVNAEFAKRRKERLETLYKQKALASDQMDEVATDARLKQLQLEQAAEARRLARLDMRQAEEVAKRQIIRSPLRGVVVRRYLSAGESVENKAIMRIAQIDPLRAEVIVPVAHFGQVKVGQQAVVVPEAPRDQPYPAVVTVVDRVADAASGTFRATLTLPNPDYGLPSGLRCSVQFKDAGQLASMDAPAPPAPRPAADAPALLAPNDVPAQAAARAAAAAPPSPAAGTILRLPELVASGAGRGPPRRLGPATVRRDDRLAREGVGKDEQESMPDGPASGAPSPAGTSRIAAIPATPGETPSPSTARPGPPGGAEGGTVCRTFGPLPDARVARAIHASLSPLAQAIAIREDEADAGSHRGYLVLSAPQGSDAAAVELLRRMQAAGLTDVAVLLKGPYAGRVSAGIYSSTLSATRRKKTLAEMGFGFEVVSRGGPDSTYWVDVRAAADMESRRRISAAVGQISASVADSASACGPRVLTAHN